MSCMRPSAPDAETALALYEDSAQITACPSRSSTPCVRLAISTRLEYGASIFTAAGVLGVMSWHGMTNGGGVGSATALAPIHALRSAASHGVVFMGLPFAALQHGEFSGVYAPSSTHDTLVILCHAAPLSNQHVMMRKAVARRSW